MVGAPERALRPYGYAPSGQTAGAPAVDPVQVAPDMVICTGCAEEIRNRSKRRYRYPFANCAYCGPRFSVLKRAPFIRGNTTFASFPPCADGLAEWAEPTSRHYHAETIVCPRCGPHVKLIRFDGRPVRFEQHSLLDDIDAACSLIQKGEVVALKTAGGYQLACDATNAAAVARLRQAKLNGNRSLPLMARDLHVIARYCAISVEEELQLTSAAGPLVVLRAASEGKLPGEVAPGLKTLAFMLPTTALHVLLLDRMNRPVVVTSGNLSGEPQILDDDEARQKLGVAVTYALVSDLRCLNRAEDSVLRVIGGSPRLLRRARGYAPAALKLPEGFESADKLLAIGGDRKAAFCLVTDGKAIPFGHYGDLSDATDCNAYQEQICRFRRLFRHELATFVVDAHHGYHSSRLARIFAAQQDLDVIEVQHHVAHLASCLAENGRPFDAPPVLGIVLDGAGPGGDGSLWGGEFLFADYRGYERIGSFRPIPLPGGRTSVSQPWRSLQAHLDAAIGWPVLEAGFGALELYRYLEGKRRPSRDAVPLSNASPLSSACAHLFDSVAAALGICREEQTYDGEAAMRLEAMVDEAALQSPAPEAQYPVQLTMPEAPSLATIEVAGMWRALLGDLGEGVPAPVIAARFHRWLAASIAAMAAALARKQSSQARHLATVALSGGCFQNRILLEETERLLRRHNFEVLSHERVPPGAGGLALGQAAVAAAYTLAKSLAFRAA
jgi:hydrogenase maturation protein HypF